MLRLLSQRFREIDDITPNKKKKYGSAHLKRFTCDLRISNRK